MKKQVFILMFFVLAFFAGNKTVNAQPYATPHTAPQAVACTPDELHPVAGVPYTYEMTASPTGGTWNWWATKNTTFIDATTGIPSDSLNVAAGELLNASGNYGKTVADVGGNGSVTITWSDAILAGTSYHGDNPTGSPTFVAGYYEAPATACADNLKVYEIDPIHAFVVDILSIDPASIDDYGSTYTPTYGTTPAQCVSDIVSAVYNTTSYCMEYNYGTNYLYFEFVAANFSDYWVPTFVLTGADANQVLTYEYTYASPNTWGATAPTWTTLTSGTTQIQVDPSVTSTENGVSVFVRVTVENATFENTAGQTLAMALDGQNSLGLWDVVNADCSDPNVADQNDSASQTITERPTLTPVTTGAAPNSTVVQPCP